MKILCAVSGIEFQCEHFPAYLTSREVTHPIFHLPQKKLLSFIPKFSAGELTETDSYLLFVALLASSDAVEFRVPCKRIAETSGIVYNNMEDLCIAIGKMNLIKHPSFQLPRIAITPDTCTLQNIEYWIANWEASIEEWKDGYASYNESRDLIMRESALEKLIKSPHREIQLATQIADWAEIAGAFPKHPTLVNGSSISLSHYWKQIIRKCINKESIYLIPLSDLQELIEHCEEYIPHGSIYAHTLMEILRAGRDRNKNFLGLGDWDLTTSSISYKILEDGDSVEAANYEAILMSAPISEPRITEYPTRFAWLKAKVKWEMSQEAALAKQAMLDRINSIEEVAPASDEELAQLDESIDTADTADTDSEEL